MLEVGSDGLSSVAGTLAVPRRLRAAEVRSDTPANAGAA